MPYLTMKKNLKLQLSPGLVASYDIQQGNGVGQFWDTKHTHIFTYLLTFPRPTRGINSVRKQRKSDISEKWDNYKWHHATMHDITLPLNSFTRNYL